MVAGLLAAEAVVDALPVIGMKARGLFAMERAARPEIAAPFASVRFVPSGGVNPSNAAEYLRHPAVFGISGSWMVTRDAISARDFGSIARLSRRATDIVAEAT